MKTPPRYTQAAIDQIEQDIRLTSKTRADYQEWLAGKQAELAVIAEANAFWAAVDSKMFAAGFVRNKYPAKTADGTQPAYSGYYRKDDKRFVSNADAANA
jgi:hypothetical protein